MKDHGLLAIALQQMGIPQPEVEHTFDDKRKWRFDLAWPDRKIAIEIQGGVWSRGRHVRGKGYLNDCAKLNEAQLQGWTVYWVPTDWWSDGTAYELLERIFA